MSQLLPCRAVMAFMIAKSCHAHTRTPLHNPRRLHNPFTRAPSRVIAQHRAGMRLAPDLCLSLGQSINSTPKAPPILNHTGSRAAPIPQAFALTAIVISAAATTVDEITAPGPYLTAGQHRLNTVVQP